MPPSSHLSPRLALAAVPCARSPAARTDAASDLLPKLGTLAAAGYSYDPSPRQLQVRPWTPRVPRPAGLRARLGRLAGRAAQWVALCRRLHPRRIPGSPAASGGTRFRHQLWHSPPPAPQSLAGADPGALAEVEDFTLTRSGVGSLRWLVPVDVRRLQLDAIARIDAGEVAVYTDCPKPPVGSELNTACEVTLLGVHKRKGGQVRARAHGGGLRGAGGCRQWAGRAVVRWWLGDDCRVALHPATQQRELRLAPPGQLPPAS